MILERDILDASILIVDDQAANVSLLEQLLDASGYGRIASTTHSREVCAMHRMNRYDLILLDLQMPVMDGFQVMHELHTIADDHYLPVIVLTAQPVHRLRALKAGAKDFICKPFDVVEVGARIHNMLEVRLLCKTLDSHNKAMKQAVQDSATELHDSEARYRSLTVLPPDWSWRTDEGGGSFTQLAGPVLEMLDIRVVPLTAQAGDVAVTGWSLAERKALEQDIASRMPCFDFVFHRVSADGLEHLFRVSGQPLAGQTCRRADSAGAEAPPKACRFDTRRR